MSMYSKVAFLVKDLAWRRRSTEQLAEGLEFSFAWRLRWPRNAVKLAGSG
jgi:hypothetical protein